MVGVGGEELVDEVALGTHDLDAVVLGGLGQYRTIDEILNLLLDTFLVQLFRLERVDRRLNGAGRYLLGAIGITTGVEDLHADLAARLVHCAGHDRVFLGFFYGRQFGRTGIHPTLFVRANATGNHQADATPGALGEVGGHTLETARLLFEASVHRPHQGAVAQGSKAKVERGQQVRVVSSGHDGLHNKHYSRYAGASIAAAGPVGLSAVDIKALRARAQ
ncbi:hypothetical protein D3C80_969840 [compost metagenome]